jgi:hypothetical protein
VPSFKEIELKSESFRILQECSSWVQRALAQGNDQLRELDEIAAGIEEHDSGQRELLKNKAKNICASGNANEIDRQAFSFFAELKAYKEFSDKSYNVAFLAEESNRKTPDLKVWKDGSVIFGEVKRIRSPFDEDENLRTKDSHFGDVNEKFREGLRKKIEYFVEDALEKFDSVGATVKEQRILVIDYAIATNTIVKISEAERHLDGILGSEYFRELKEKYNIQISRRKYF